jgi:hypothetical protein
MKATNRAAGDDASEKISQRIKELGDWRGELLARLRKLIHEADPEIMEEWKWMGTPIFSHDGIVCTGESYRQVIKLTFARGAALPDPKKLFNSSMEGNTRRAIDIREGEKVNEAALKQLIRAAVAANSAAIAERAVKKGLSKRAAKPAPAKPVAKKAPAKPVAKKAPGKPVAKKAPAKRAAKKK